MKGILNDTYLSTIPCVNLPRNNITLKGLNGITIEQMQKLIGYHAKAWLLEFNSFVI